MPAYNEERAIARAIRAVPGWIDQIIVIDDASTDRTPQRIEGCRAKRLDVIRHDTNRGVGAAIATGYDRVLKLGIDVAVVMAGDGQMDPGDLSRLLTPIADGQADYVKGNRFLDRLVWREMPLTRICGNLLLSMATKFTSGYRHIFDSQCGYSAITKQTLRRLKLDQLFPRYGYPNQLLARLHVIGARVVDVAVKPIYGPGWRSGIGLRTVVYPVAFVLLRSWVQRLRDENKRDAYRPIVNAQLSHQRGTSAETKRASRFVSEPRPVERAAV